MTNHSQPLSTEVSLQDLPRYNDTTATQKIFSMRKRIRVVTGGTSASKTISIMFWLIDYCQTPTNRNKIATVVSESYPHLSGGAIRDFNAIMRDRGYWKDALWNDTKHIYTFETGNKLEFLSVDTYSKAHGPRRDVLFVNECNNLSYQIVDQLMTRTREVVWLDFNPVNEFWFYTELLPFRKEEIDFITLTYLDNEALDPETVREIESHRHNKAWWTVYGEGKLGRLESSVFRDWLIIDEIPHEARLVRYGLDFGFTNDPSVLIARYEYNGGHILDQVAYVKGLSNKGIADILNASPRALCMADSAEPKSIEEISGYGVLIVGAAKGPGSVMQGIQRVQAEKISITSRSVQTIKAYRNYIFVTDRNGVVVNEVDDTVHEWSNPMDAIRYSFDGPLIKKHVPQTNFGGVLPHIPGTLA